jgi:hypothetical protein
LGYTAMAVSFYLYITRTAQIEPDVESELLSTAPSLKIVAGGADQGVTRKAA